MAKVIVMDEATAAAVNNGSTLVPIRRADGSYIVSVNVLSDENHATAHPILQQCEQVEWEPSDD